MNSKTICYFLLFCLTLLYSCQRKNAGHSSNDEFLLPMLTNADKSACEEFILQGIDSKVGKIVCHTDTFSYDVGRYGYKGPISLLENFKTTFHHYHYSSFFRKIGMDEKVFKSLRDDVVIDTVYLKTDFKGETFYNCEPCNAVALITFKGKTFNYPYTDGQNILENESQYQFYYLNEKGTEYKWFRSIKNNDNVGLFISFDDTSMIDHNVSIVVSHSSDYDQSFNWLRSLRLKENMHENILFK
jgi:hypothetical protein